jgi:hypothetical protein
VFRDFKDLLVLLVILVEYLIMMFGTKLLMEKIDLILQQMVEHILGLKMDMSGEVPQMLISWILAILEILIFLDHLPILEKSIIIQQKERVQMVKIEWPPAFIL